MASTNGSTTPSPTEQAMALYEQMESHAAHAGETLVGSRGFSGLLGQLAENAAALTRLSADAMDLTLRNLRVAGRRDVVRLSRQLARTEDKLERLLQEVEDLRDEFSRRESGARGSAGTANGAAARASTRPTGRRPRGDSSTRAS